MASVYDVSSYILSRQAPKEGGELTTWKLQKLVYYAQAWATVWDDKVLFSQPIEAWANGPVCPALYELHKGDFKISKLPAGDPGKLTESAKKTVDVVLDFYGKQTAQYLSQLTHAEEPWKNARKGLAPGERGNKEITPAAMAEYYGGLYEEQKKRKK
jgi:uncharacterized phage-associated protein